MNSSIIKIIFEKNQIYNLDHIKEKSNAKTALNFRLVTSSASLITLELFNKFKSFYKKALKNFCFMKFRKMDKSTTMREKWKVKMTFRGENKIAN
jgi:hypothetical protein